MHQTPFNAVEADLTRAGVGETFAITFVVSIKEPHAPSLNPTGVNAFEYLKNTAKQRIARHNLLVHPACRAGSVPALHTEACSWVCDCKLASSNKAGRSA